LQDERTPRRILATGDRRALSFYDVNSKQWKAEPENFDIYVASSAEQINLQGKLTLQAGTAIALDSRMEGR